MSKAFTREDDQSDSGTTRRLPSPLPPGAKNYITPEGAKQLKEELARLIDTERPQAAAASSGKTASDTLRALDERILQLRTSLESAVVVKPPKGEVDSVRFGASVSVRSWPGGDAARYRIVGVDETDVARGWISWVSPIARSLVGAKIGDRVRVLLPTGEKELEIVSVDFE